MNGISPTNYIICFVLNSSGKEWILKRSSFSVSPGQGENECVSIFHSPLSLLSPHFSLSLSPLPPLSLFSLYFYFSNLNNRHVLPGLKKQKNLFSLVQGIYWNWWENYHSTRKQFLNRVPIWKTCSPWPREAEKPLLFINFSPEDLAQGEGTPIPPEKFNFETGL